MFLKHFLPVVIFSPFLFPSAVFAQQESVKLIWSPNIEPDLSHYNLYRDTQPGTMFFLTAISKPDTNYTDTQVSQGNTYYYKLTAVDIHGYESGPSNEVSADVFNDPPTINQIPNQTIAEGGSFSSIQLDNYVSDPDHSDSQLTWSYSGNSQLSVSINASRVATINIPNQNWNGSENITFKATDPGGLSASRSVTFKVNAVNDPPVVNTIPNQTIAEGGSFNTIPLDNYVSDVDNADNQMTWSYSGNSQLSVSINASRVATISIPNQNWNGSENITFKATDPGGLSASRSVTFKVNAVNDPPVISQIPNQTIPEGGSFNAIPLDNYVSDVDNADNQMTWQTSGSNYLTVTIIANRIATISSPNQDWFGAETITFTATDPGGLSASAQATFAVNAVNDAPYVKKTLVDISQSEDFGSVFIIDLNETFGDIEGDPLTFQATSAGNHVLPEIEESNLTISSTLNFFGKDTITITATDINSQLQVQDVFLVTVIPVNDPPQIINLPATLTINATGMETLNMKEYVQDVDSPPDSMQWIFFATNDSLKWQFDATTSRLTIWAGFCRGNVEFTCTVTDNQQASNDATILIIQIDNKLTDTDNLSNLIPQRFYLEQNYPNPFNPITTIRFHLPVYSNVIIEIYNITGQIVTTLLNDWKPAGIYDIEFNAGNLPTGIYFYRLKAREYLQIRRMILTK